THVLPPFPTRRSSDLRPTRLAARAAIARWPPRDSLATRARAARNLLARVEQVRRIPEQLPLALPFEQLLGLFHPHVVALGQADRSEEHTSELQSLRHL